MKNEDQYCILSVKYSILECNEETNKENKTTEIERVFTAKDKSTLLRKIQRFEDRLREKKTKGKTNLVNQASEYVSGFINRYRSSYQSLLNM